MIAPEIIAQLAAEHPPVMLSLWRGEITSSTPMERIVRKVAKLAGVPPAELMGASRARNVAHARQVAMWLARREGRSYPQVGRFFGRDHTTVMCACRKIAGHVQ